MDLLDLSDKLWRGEVSIEDHHPFAASGELAEPAPGVAFVWSFANLCAFDCGGVLLLVDTGPPFGAQAVHETVRRWSKAPVEAAVYSHGHIDHVSGAPLLDAEADAAGRTRPRIIAHEAVAPRFDRYVLTAGYNGAINARQFGVPGLRWPTEYRYPDEVYRDRLDVEVGGERFLLHHARGETDDATWTWVPERKVVACGDLFIWASPNAGNPQKVQRYPREWAVALRAMAACGAEVLLPGHGIPIAGADRVAAALNDTAALLESLVEQTLALMNDGATLDDLLHTVRAPADLIEKPYLRPVYDEPEFVVRNIWRLYGGWHDGNPANLKPARSSDLARELADLSGGAAALAGRAMELSEAGEHRLACHLIEIAVQAADDSKDVHAARAGIYERRAGAETSLMAKGIFNAAARESRERSGG